MLHAVEPAPRTRTACRSCASSLLPILSLGPTHLSDFPRSADTRAHDPVPLDLMRCSSPTCGLVQLAHTTPADWMFSTYWYRSGVNETMRQELADVVHDACQRIHLLPHDTVVDIGANDGTLLQQYPDMLPLTTCAWEPAANLYEALRPHAKILFPEYFHAGSAWGLESKAKVITAIAMFYDLDDPHAFLDGITRILHPDGVLVVQQAYLPAMLQTAGFDNIVHEHLEYYDLRALEAVLEPHGLVVVDVEPRAINGGSFRATIQFRGRHHPHPRVEAMRRSELEFFADRPAVFAAFAHRVEHVKEQVREVLDTYAQQDQVVDLLGASTKGATFLQDRGLDRRTIRQAWERSPEKWGRFYGVSGIPIVSEAEGRKDPPAALFSLIWQFKDALIQREQDYLHSGGRIIFPLPSLVTVEHHA